MKTLDIGCGSNKTPGAVGMDIHPYEGVDIVHNLEKYPWPQSDSEYDKVVCSHVIEHIEDITAFMREIHRITKPGGEVFFATPHFSSANSWTDPTHRKHLSLQWYKLFTEGYLGAQTGRFELLSSDVTFGKSLRSKIGKCIARWRGQEKWEKNSAFVYPGMDILTYLRVQK